MAEYCSQCSPFKEYGGYDFDLLKIAIELERGHSYSFVCEGCLNRAIYKDEDGQLWIYQVQQGTDELKPVPTTVAKLKHNP